MDDKEFISETETEESFEELLNQSPMGPFYFNPGEKVEAVITKITDEWVFIDSGSKSDGYILISEFIDDKGEIAINEGDTINAYFLSSRNNEMLFTTRLTGDNARSEHLEQAFHNNIPVQGMVEKEIKGGFEVKIAGNIRAFCPYSQMGLRRTEDTDQYIGQHLTFKMTEYGERGRNIVVSNRAVLEEERQKLKESLKETLKEGMTIGGEITSIREFGAFVDIGGLEGLLPISEISWGRVEDISSFLSVGQKVDIAIKSLDWENDKFSFSLKEILPDPWDDIGSRYPEGSIHKGRVARLAPFGAFVTLAPGIDGLIHISALAKGKKINHPREVLEENQDIEVRIARVKQEERRLSLSMVSDDQDPEEYDSYSKHLTANGSKSSGSLGTLGDILKAKLDKK